MIQDDRHDWFGELAETHVGYLAAREGFEVFGAGKWTADVAIHDKDSRSLYRVEVRATDRDRRPTPEPSRKLAGMAEVLAEVTTPDGSRLNVTFWKLDSQGRKRPLPRLTDPAPGQFRDWLLQSRVTATEDLPDLSDPLLALSGAFDSELTDVGERHDDYLGQALAAESRTEPEA